MALQSRLYRERPLNLIGAMGLFKDNLLFSGLLFVAIIISFVSSCLLSAFPGWRTSFSDVDVKPFPSKPVSQAALACAFVSALVLLITSLWQHVGAVGAAAIANHGNVKTDIGTGAMVIAWISFVVTTMSMGTSIVMIPSMIISDRLTDE
ncbi:hypothetical protein EJ07DRAFT_129494 [Lizonia empirigonia]|nr:hypothetical protein EJ07DRAFT_129494 [Lizonia empirigonia]